MKPFNIKISIAVICAALLTLFAPQKTSAQELFNGVVTYKMSMNGASATTCTVYYRGRDYLTDMPQNKLRTLYLSEEKKMYSIMSMMGKPIVSSFDFDGEILSTNFFDDSTPTEEIAGHHCLRITSAAYSEEDLLKFMEGKSRSRIIIFQPTATFCVFCILNNSECVIFAMLFAELDV